MPHKDLTRIIQGLGTKELYTPQRIYLGTVSTIKPGPDIDIQAILLKIARGLHAVHAQEIIPPSYERAACLYGHGRPQPPLEDLEKTHVQGSVGNFFHYRGGWAADDPKACVWYMLFYHHLVGVAIFNRPRLNETQHENPASGSHEEAQRGKMEMDPT